MDYESKYFNVISSKTESLGKAFKKASDTFP